MEESQKTILLGVTGCIAAYKACELVRALQKLGYRVKVCMTKNATEFVGTATFRALTHEPVALDLFSAPADPIYHISLANEADVVIVAPCTANVLAKIACGIADDLLTTTLLATKAPLIVAPAMNASMYEAQVTQENINKLRQRGVVIVDAEEGYLACGSEGKGRLADTNKIVVAVEESLKKTEDLAAKHVLITAGPTREKIDPVRYISNNSSGKMGYAIAKEAAARGAHVTLVSGPVSLSAPCGVDLIEVESAQDMLHACEGVFDECDIAIFSAAVSDMRPKTPAAQKLKKGSDSSALEMLSLVENPDILATCASEKTQSQVVVGFAAETCNLIEAAKQKLVKKHASFIVANDVSQGKVFGEDTNLAKLVFEDRIEELPEMSKAALATKILDSCMEFAQANK
jgi:phosphopantothenoylcysteine decarboxylase / phosphopantothenate---cysteine ligase